jgi:hypothetical protein
MLARGGPGGSSAPAEISPAVDRRSSCAAAISLIGPPRTTRRGAGAVLTTLMRLEIAGSATGGRHDDPRSQKPGRPPRAGRMQRRRRPCRWRRRAPVPTYPTTHQKEVSHERTTAARREGGPTTTRKASTRASAVRSTARSPPGPPTPRSAQRDQLRLDAGLRRRYRRHRDRRLGDPRHTVSVRASERALARPGCPGSGQCWRPTNVPGCAS